ncbi:DUF4267 domain-containing protein [Nonomuraea muscovyensis]|uniref:DUF4267 domain-containing protein n=1 Tax=Nonomuraea muscovyensis TaxID=1124761 RepID=UPI0033CF1F86
MLAGLIAIGIILIGIRLLLQPVASAAGYGVPVSMNAYLTVKGVRDITAGLVVAPGPRDGKPAHARLADSRQCVRPAG